MTPELNRRRFTTAEYDRMVEVGILSDDEWFELIEGMILQREAPSPLEVASILRLTHVLSVGFPQGCLLAVHESVVLSDYSELVPDLVLMHPERDFYPSGHPHPGDIFLLVEIGALYLNYDRDVKVPLYAQAGIPEVWLVDVENAGVLVYREPAAKGYANTRVARPGDWVAPVAFPDHKIAVSDILG